MLGSVNLGGAGGTQRTRGIQNPGTPQNNTCILKMQILLAQDVGRVPMSPTNNPFGQISPLITFGAKYNISDFGPIGL